MSPQQRVVLVTGGAGQIGQSVANVLIEAGAIVALADLKKPTLESEAPAQSWSGHIVDVQDDASCERLLQEVIEQHGRLDGLVNNAGIVQRGPASTMAAADVLHVLDVNTVGAFRMSQAAFPALRKSKGAIVNLGSTNGHIAVKNTVGYCISKAAVMHLGKVLALEWAEYGIRVNSVGPTIVPTAMTADVRADAAYMKEKMESIPLGRMATTADVAYAIEYLLSERAGMITGQTIFVDGGVLTH